MKKKNTFVFFLLSSLLPFLMLFAGKQVSANDAFGSSFAKPAFCIVTDDMISRLISPADGSTLANGSATFQRNDTQAEGYRLDIGTTLNGTQVGSYPFPQQTLTVQGLPVNGETLYVRLQTRIEGGWYPRSYTFIAGTAPTPVSVRLTADPMILDSGGETRLSWTAAGADTLEIDNGIGVVTGASIMVRPAHTTTYVIIATGGGGTARDSVTVVVREASPTVVLRADPLRITRGESSTLRWTATGADTLTLDHGIGTVTGNSYTVSPSDTTTYTITAQGPGGTATGSVTVTVDVPGHVSPQPAVLVALEEGTGIAAADTSGNNYNGVLASRQSGGPLPQWVDGIVGRYALDFNSVDTGVDFPDSPLFDSTVFTIAVWLTSGNGPMATAAAVKHSERWQLVSVANELCFVYTHGEIIHSGYFFPSAEEWHHYAAVVNDDLQTVTFYVDGVRVGDAVSYPVKSPTGPGGLLLGRFDDRIDYRWNGLIDDFRFYAQELDAADIAELVRMGAAGSALQVGRNELQIVHDNVARTFVVQIPTDYDPRHLYPVVFAFHRRGGTNDEFTVMESLINSEKFIGVYPQGVGNAWNTGFGYEPSSADDVGFVQDIYRFLMRRVPVDTARVYAYGVSGGGGMVYRLGAETDIFAGIASIAYSFYAEQTVPASAPRIAVLQIHGDEDTFIPYGGGTGSLGIDFQSAEHTAGLWSAHNGFTGSPTVDTSYPDVTIRDYTMQGVTPEVRLYTLAGRGHFLPSTVAGTDTNQLVWEFFRRNARQQ